MAVGRLEDIVLELLLFVQAATGHALPGDRPDVALVPATYLERAACEGPCRIRGWYPYGRTVYLDSRLDPVADLQARGILLHELVHYVQHQAHVFEGGDPCQDWQQREQEAHRVQARWLFEQRIAGHRVRVGRRGPWTVNCTAATAAPE